MAIVVLKSKATVPAEYSRFVFN